MRPNLKVFQVRVIKLGALRGMGSIQLGTQDKHNQSN